MKKTVEEQEAAMEAIDDLIAEYLEQIDNGIPEEELRPMLREVFTIFREYCPFDDIVDHMYEVEKRFENNLKRKLH
jgi:hypothetical protein